MDDYKPETYNKARRDFTLSEQNLVDSESDYRSPAGSKAGSVVNLPGYQWNSVDKSKDVAVPRRSWITTEDRQPITYDVDLSGTPL